MRFVLWSVFAILALAWTGGAALLAQLVEWAAQGIAAPGADPIGAAASAVTLPPWLGPWVDADAWNAAVQWVAGLLSSSAGWLPALGQAVSWLVPAVWLAWGVGLAALAGLTLAGHWWMGRLGKPRAPDVRPA